MSNSHVEWLRQAAKEIASEGHNGWGNACTDAAADLERLQSELDRANARERKAFEALEWIGDGHIDDLLEIMDYARSAVQQYRSQDDSEVWPNCSRCGKYLGAGYKEGGICLECFDDSEGRAGEGDD